MAEWMEAGQRGKDVRSDCWVRYQPRSEGGLDLTLNSKVESMYGTHIRVLAKEILETLGIRHAQLIIEDAGALPFVLAARIETVVKRAHPELKTSFLPEMKEFCRVPAQRERLRRSRLYLPGNEPKFFINAGLHDPDGVILDLEDSVSYQEKDAARILVRNTLRQVDFYRAERMVRINQLPMGLDDLREIAFQNVHVVLIPKCEDASQVTEVERMIARVQQDHGLQGQPVYLMPIIESALGIMKAFEIARASSAVIALTIGLEDYTADLGVPRTNEGRESFWARCQIVNAARAAGVQPIDTVFSDVADMDGLRQAVLEARGLGFEGKGCIHPRQINTIHQAFAPTPAEIEKAQRIVRAFDDAQKAGLSVVSLGRKMIDPPVVKRALQVVNLAIMTGLLPPEWKSQAQAQ
ncbi:HpcH/HpaI aldolase/citrate lyase family protein [bacterium]|nr:HpcH/HpaI aldolase/citrate lyase family protein [bacterium]